MKLLQLNIWGGRLAPQLSDLIKQEQPDIFCVQEAISYGAGSPLFMTTEEIQTTAALPYEAFGPAFSFNFMSGVAKFGNGVYSQFPTSSTQTVYMDQPHIENFTWGVDNGNARNFVHASLSIDGVTCHIITHHGFWIREHKHGNEETMRQMTVLHDYVRTLEGPIILTGDFNLAPDSESLAQLNELLTNLSITHALPTTRTALTTKTETCDYVFVNDLVSVKKFEVLEKVASDHKALLLEFEL